VGRSDFSPGSFRGSCRRRLRARVRQRLQENAEVVGTDEAFFEDDQSGQTIRDLFTEKAGILDGDDETDVDLASYAFQIWKNAIDRDPALQKIIADLPNVVLSTKPHKATKDERYREFFDEGSRL
jgi:hypothetical protein